MSLCNQSVPSKNVIFFILGNVRQVNYVVTKIYNIFISRFRLHYILYLYYRYRTILAALHFNFNLQRGTKKDKEGNEKLRLTYPKFKDGEVTVREVREKQNYGKSSHRKVDELTMNSNVLTKLSIICLSNCFLDYVSEIFNTLACTKHKELKVLAEELKKDVPDPLHTMLGDKQTKDEAIEKFISRKGKTTALVPPTCSGMSTCLLFDIQH